MFTTEDYQAEFEIVKTQAAAHFTDWGVTPNNVEWWREVYSIIHERKAAGIATYGGEH